MEIDNFNDLSFNYYVNTSSYVKTILDILPEEKISKKKKAIIIEIFNYIMSNISEDEINEVMVVSNLFNQKLELLSNKEIMFQLEYLYRNFLEKMLFDSYNRMTYFSIMNECVKVFAGYYEEYQKDSSLHFDEEISNIRIR